MSRTARRPRRPGTPQGDRPDFASMALPPLVERPAPTALAARFAAIHDAIGSPNRLLRTYTMGAATVIVTREFGRWHLSVSRADRDPTWHEVAHAWYGAIPGASGLTGALILPPLDEYVNINKHCFQVSEIDPTGPGDRMGGTR